MYIVVHVYIYIYYKRVKVGFSVTTPDQSRVLHLPMVQGLFPPSALNEHFCCKLFLHRVDVTQLQEHNPGLHRMLQIPRLVKFNVTSKTERTEILNKEHMKAYRSRFFNL